MQQAEERAVMPVLNIGFYCKTGYSFANLQWQNWWCHRSKDTICSVQRGKGGSSRAMVEGKKYEVLEPNQKLLG